jgi:hypothetical protein
MGQPLQLAVHDGRDPVEGIPVRAAPAQEELGDGGRSVRDDDAASQQDGRSADPTREDHMLNRVSRPFSVLTILTTLAPVACAGTSASYSRTLSHDSNPLVIDVENRNWWDVEVELDAEGTQFRLGVAPSYGRVRFRVSASRLGGASYFRLIANPMDTRREAFTAITGRGAAVTPVIELLEHRSVSWTLGSSETTTNLVVR